MAVEVERLVAVLEARVDKYEKAFKKASSTGDAALRDMEKRGATFAATMNDNMARGTKGMETFAKAAGAAKMQTANLAAQFQDIAVQLKSGASPMTIALQQGTQISAVLGPMGARGSVAALGGAFASLLNPVSLATIGIIGLGGVAINYFSELVGGADQSAERLKEQADLIKNVADRWGEALPALMEYQRSLQDAADTADIIKAGDVAAVKQYDALNASLYDLSARFAEVTMLMQDFGLSTDVIASLQNAWNDLNQKVEEGKATAQDAEAVQKALADTFASTGIPAVEAMAAQVGNLAAMLNAASASALKLRAEAASLAGTKMVPAPQMGLSPIYSGGGAFLNEQQHLDFDASNTKSQTQLTAEKSARKGRSTAARVSDYERETGSIQKKIDALRAESAALAGLNPLQADYAYQIEKAQVAQELLAAAEESKIKITPALKASIDGLAASYATATIATKDLKVAHDEAMKAAKDFADFGKDALRGFIDDLVAGKSAAEALAGVLNKIGSKLLDIGMNSLFSGKGGGLLSMLFGGGGLSSMALSAISGSVGLFHSGGVAGAPTQRRSVNHAVFAGAPRYHSGGIAGLRPDEVPAILQKGEVVIPRGGARGGNRSMSINVNVAGARGNQEIQQMVAAGVSNGLRQYDRALPSRVAQISNDPRRR